jgi:hypothetical protein
MIRENTTEKVRDASELELQSVNSYLEDSFYMANVSY